MSESVTERIGKLFKETEMSVGDLREESGG